MNEYNLIRRFSGVFLQCILSLSLSLSLCFVLSLCSSICLDSACSLIVDDSSMLNCTRDIVSLNKRTLRDMSITRHSSATLDYLTLVRAELV